MSTMILECPVCGAENIRTYWTEEQWLCEDHYNCSNCGFFDHTVYGSGGRGIDTVSGTPGDQLRKIYLAMKHNRKIKELHLEINPECMNYL